MNELYNSTLEKTAETQKDAIKKKEINCTSSSRKTELEIIALSFSGKNVG